jgi:uncharacterized protein (TIGR01777 family)
MSRSTPLSFHYRSSFPVPVEDLFGWHERPAALERLNTPWAPFTVVHSSRSIHNGSTVSLRIPVVGPVSVPLRVVHEGYQRGVQFQDRQVAGPFRSWLHTHRFSSTAPNSSVLDDIISYALPSFLPRLDPVISAAESELLRTFWYRHQILARDIEHPLPSRPLTVGITGSSGLVGSSLMPFLSMRGHRLVPIVRASISAPDGQFSQARWNPSTGELDTKSLEGIDALVHLAGESIAQLPWTKDRKDRIRSSRVGGTARLVEAIRRMKNPPSTVIMASAIGLYGANRSDIVNEESERGDGFLADVVQEWEAAASDFAALGTRVVFLRFGVILSARGGLLSTVLPPFKGGLGGPLGSGEQRMNWISIEDGVRLIESALTDPLYSGAYNAVSPSSVTNREFTKTLGSLLHRPTLFRLPAALLRATLGEAANELMLATTKVVSSRLSDRGFVFLDDTIESCLRLQLGCPPASAREHLISDAKQPDQLP